MNAVWARVRHADPAAWPWARLLAIAVTVAVVAAFLVPEWGVLTPDTKPELYLNPDRLLRRAMTAWQPVPNLGGPNYNTGVAPVAAVVVGLQSLGLDPWASQRVLAIVLTLLAGAGMHALAREVGDGTAGVAAVVAGAAYALHPYAVVSGSTLPVRLPHAVLPWLVLATARALVRGRPWRVAGAALCWAGMAGINGGIVNLMLALAVPIVGWWVARTHDVAPRVLWRRGGALVGVYAALSAYWVVPTLLALATSAGDVAGATETPASIASVSSPAEVLRGLGMWTLYLAGPDGPFVPGHAVYLTSWLPALASLALVLLACVGSVVAAPRTRRLAMACVVVTLPLLVGLYPPDSPTGFGRALRWGFEHVPGLLGFRTTNKFGSLLVLGLALLVGRAAAARWRRRSLAPLVVGVVALAALPLWRGDAQPVRMDVPAYWQQAAASLDRGDAGRLLFAPGNFQARYAWGYTGVDDLDTALFDHRDVVWRSTIPTGSRAAANLLTSFDEAVNTRSATAAATAAWLDLLGVSDVLVRADSLNTADGAASATTLLDTYADVPGARVRATWGPTVTQEPGLLDVTGPTAALTQVDVGDDDRVRLLPAAHGLVLVGDGRLVGDLATLGYEPARRDLSWLDDLGDPELLTTLDRGARIVLSDTNRRRTWDARGLARRHTEVLPPDAPLDPGTTRVRSLDVHDQTTAFLDVPGAYAGMEVASSDLSSADRVVTTPPGSGPLMALDDDPTTAWRTGAFGTGDERWLQVAYAQPVDLGRVTVQVDTTVTNRAQELRMVTPFHHEVVEVDADGRAAADLPGAVDWFRLEVVDATAWDATPLGIRDIDLPGSPVHRGLRLPTALWDRAEAGPQLAAALAAAPVDVVFSRLQAGPLPDDDEEHDLVREFWIPAGDRTMDVAAVLAPDVARFSAPDGPDAARFDECVAVGVLDGRTVRLRVTATLGDLRRGAAVVAGACGDVAVAPGPHVFRSDPGWRIDTLVLRDTSTSLAPPPDAGTVRVRAATATRLAVRVQASEPAVLATGIAATPGWTAHLDGTPMDPARVAGGYALGWSLPAGTHDVEVTYVPQAATRTAFVVSGVAAVAAAATVAAGLLRQRRARR